VANNPVQGFPDTWGKHGVAVIEHNGPSSYVQVANGGDTALTTPSWGGSSTVGTRAFSYVDNATDYSGAYQVTPVYSSANTPNAGIRNAVALRWTYSGLVEGQTGVNAAEVVIGTSPTNGTYTITATTGVGQIQVVVAGGAVTSVRVLNPGSYTTAPTFTPPAGLGGGATITALIGSRAGLEVAPGTNLSGFTVRLLVVGG
jgi:hypothetical protein